MTFDPDVASFRDILEVFFAIHDPTTLNRQGNDAGTQYRSAIFYHSDEQRATAEQVIRELTAEKAFRDPIVTEVAPAIYILRRGRLSSGILRQQSAAALLYIRGGAEGPEVPP